MKYPNHPANMVADVRQFLMIAQPELMVAPHSIPPKETIILCKKLIDEEVNKELFEELDKLIEGKYSIERMALIQDAYIDTIYVSIWAMIVLNLPVYAAWNEIQRSNMAKFPKHEACNGQGCNFKLLDTSTNPYIHYHCAGGLLVQRNHETGKVMKPEGWTEPESWEVLYRTWNIWKLQNDPGIIRNKDIQKLEGV